MEERMEPTIPGGIILCSAKESERPYRIPGTDVLVYSMEELCYYLYHHIYFLSREMFTITLAEWMQEEFGMTETAKKLGRLLSEKCSLKDLIVTILCSVDYYVENEIRSLVHIMEELDQLSQVKKSKMKADCLLNEGKINEAFEEYQSVIQREEILEFSTEEYGNLLHNMALCYAQMDSMNEAKEAFLEAYEKNHHKESLLAWSKLLQIEGEEDARQHSYDQGVTSQEYEKIGRLLSDLEKEADELPISKGIKRMFDNEEEGFRAVDLILDRWQQDYIRCKA